MNDFECATDSNGLKKTLTGIESFDRITCGGLPRERTTLVLGGPGTGKTVFALQLLANGARRGEPGIFVTFEENPRRLKENAASFGWDLEGLERQGKLFFLDAHLPGDIVHSGAFELAGLLAGIKAKATEMGAHKIVFDSIDVLLTLLNDIPQEKKQMYALSEWIVENGYTGVISIKAGEDEPRALQRYGFMQFMADCIVSFSHGLVEEVSVREVRIVKFRGSGISEDNFPVVIGPQGMEVVTPYLPEMDFPAPATTDRASSGVERLDTMLSGGYLRGTSILVTGSPGTAKTTLAVAFAEAACRRGEKVLYVSFDERSDTLVRDMASVGIRLKPHIESGCLSVVYQNVDGRSAEKTLLSLLDLIRRQKPTSVVFDPLSALTKTKGRISGESLSLQLVHLAVSRGITLLLTSLSEGNDPMVENPSLRVSTIADTWIHTAFLPLAGERNRTITVIKSRGTAHSNQLRELMLSEEGINLADVYTEGGAVLVGTLRWEKEREAALQRETARSEHEIKLQRLRSGQSQILTKIRELQEELESQQAAERQLMSLQKHTEELWVKIPEEVRAKRGVDRNRET